MKKKKYTSKEMVEVIYLLSEDLGTNKEEFENGDSERIIDTFLMSYLLANVDDLVDLWNDRGQIK